MERNEAVAPGTQRVFSALGPDDEVRSPLAPAARRMHRVLNGRRTRDASIHLTLAFVGEVDIDAGYAVMPEPLVPIEWQVEECVLASSELLPKGACHEIVARWRLD